MILYANAVYCYLNFLKILKTFQDTDATLQKPSPKQILSVVYSQKEPKLWHKGINECTLSQTIS